MEPGQWLRDGEVSLAIAFVILVTNEFQGKERGFSYLPQDAVQNCEWREKMNVEPVVRPGRPMFVPIQYRRHFVVLIIQRDEDQDTTVSILDSKAHYYNANN